MVFAAVLVLLTVIGGALCLGLIPQMDMRGKITKWVNCDESKDMALSYKNILVSRTGLNNYTIEGDIVVTKEISAPLEMEFIISKCKDINVPDTCEIFTTIASKNACSELSKGKGPLKKFFEHCDKKVKCPIPPGTYHITKYPLEIPDAARSMSMVSKWWHITSHGTSAGHQVMCSDIKGAIWQEKSRKRAGGSR